MSIPLTLREAPLTFGDSFMTSALVPPPSLFLALPQVV